MVILAFLPSVLRIYGVILHLDYKRGAYRDMTRLFATIFGVGFMAWAILKITEKIAEGWDEE